MRIDAIILREVHMPLVRPFETSFGVTRNRRIVLAEVQSEGLTGWGECTAGERPFFSGESTDTAWQVLVNELAPRPHNSYHESERGCLTSQFEQLVRTTCNLPLGSTELISPCAIVNLLGEVWLDAPNGSPDFAAALAVQGVRLHLYEKHTPRVGRKMGHLSAVGATAGQALERVLEAKRLL